MKEEKITVDPFSYGYEQDQVTAINANSILNVMSFLEQVIATQPKMGALLQYPRKVDEVKDKDGNLIKVNVDWQDHTKDSFFYTAADINGAVPIMTDLSLKAHQLLYAYSQIHQSNINNKIAKKIEDLNADTVFRA